MHALSFDIEWSSDSYCAPQYSGNLTNKKVYHETESLLVSSLFILFGSSAQLSAANNTEKLAGIDGEFRFEIQSANCGEFDPYELGDTCLFDLKNTKGELVGLIGDFETFMAKYTHEQIGAFSCQDLGVRGTDLKRVRKTSILKALNQPARKYYWLKGSALTLINDPARPRINLEKIPHAVGASSEGGAYLGYDELEAFEHYPTLGDGKLVQLLRKGKAARQLSVTQMIQLKVARFAISQLGNAYGEALLAGQYLNDPETNWEVAEMIDPRNDRSLDVVRFNEKDDGSYSVVFSERGTTPLYIYYEN